MAVIRQSADFRFLSDLRGFGLLPKSGNGLDWPPMEEPVIVPVADRSAGPSSEDRDGRDGQSRLGSALGLLGSLALHIVFLLLVLLAWKTGMAGTQGDLQFIPIDVVAPQDSDRAILRQAAKPAPLEPEAETKDRGNAPEPADDLGAQLRALSELRQAEAGEPAVPQAPASPSLATLSDATAPGRLAALRDFIRVQIERHWSPDLKSLAGEDFSIPIKIRIDKSGSVLKAEIVHTPRGDDPVFHEAAVGARNAALAASPLTLPDGHYDDVTELVLYLHPSGSLH